MNIDVVGRAISTLPPDDDHPYRTGAWQPNLVEYDAIDCEVVGELPADLNGVYLRNTENPLHESLDRLYHPFDGDGMVHMMRFRDGRAEYRNRFVRTAGLAAETEAGHALWSGILGGPDASVREEGWGARTRMKDASSTDVVVHNGRALTSFYQCGDLYQLDPYTLDDLGRATFNGKFPAWGVSAHTKVDEATNELLVFSYAKEAPYLRYGVVDGNDDLAHWTDVPLPGPRLPHDMAFTEHYAILNDCPLFWDADLLAQGAHVPRFRPDVPTRFAVLPRRGTAADVRWFEADPTYVLHWANAYEDGDTIVLDGYFQRDPAPAATGDEPDRYMRAFRGIDLHRMQTRFHRWRFDLTTGETTEEDLSDTVMEFPMVNARYAGRPYRYAYNMTGKPGWFLFDSIVKIDLATGREDRYKFGAGVYGSETPMAPRANATAEDDGYLVTFTTDVGNDCSECLVFDAQDITAGPVARVRLPERIASGTHAYWASDPV